MHFAKSWEILVNHGEAVHEKLMRSMSTHEGQAGQGEASRKQRLRNKTWQKPQLAVCLDAVLYGDSRHTADLWQKGTSERLLTALWDCVGSVEASVTAILKLSVYLDAQGVIDIWSLILIHRVFGFLNGKDSVLRTHGLPTGPLLVGARWL